MDGNDQRQPAQGSAEGQQPLDQQQGYGQSGHAEWQADDLRQPGRGWDKNYHAWREGQLQQFDRDYADYRRERQHDPDEAQAEFERGFNAWRSQRQGQAGSAGGAATSASDHPQTTQAEPTSGSSVASTGLGSSLGSTSRRESDTAARSGGHGGNG